MCDDCSGWEPRLTGTKASKTAITYIEEPQKGGPTMQQSQQLQQA